MALTDQWKRIAFDQRGNPVKHIWDEFSAKEKAAYILILNEKISNFEGTAKELADKLGMSNLHLVAFLDGIQECVDNLPSIPSIEDDTEIKLNIEFDRLYKQMVAYKAEELYNLEEWSNIFTEEEQKTLYTEQKRSHTVVRNEAKTGRNSLCSCGSNKKYKKCCGAN